MTLGHLDPWRYALAEWAAPAEVLWDLPPQGRAWSPLPHQVPPAGDWFGWLLLAGRGAGKTDACAKALDDHVNGPACLPDFAGGHRPAIIAPTLGDALDACVNGPSGIKAHNPEVRSAQTTGGTYVRWPNGTEGKLFGAHTPDDVERLRAGGNRCIVWAEELAAWRRLDEAWEHMTLGLRLGPCPRVIASTTPKARLLLKRLLADPRIVVTRATTNDNPHLAASVREALFAAYGGTRLGRQELYAELLEDVEGALWSRSWIDAHRRPASEPPRLGIINRIVVALDPADGLAEGDEQAIVVACRTLEPRYYVIHSEGVRMSPKAWLQRAATLFEHFKADQVVYEKNHGGRFLTELLRTVAPDLPAKAVDATAGKRTRAEPISALYEQGKVSHVGEHDVLEDQLCTFTGAPGERSPDRLDALVWALTELARGSHLVPSVPSHRGVRGLTDDLLGPKAIGF